MSDSNYDVGYGKPPRNTRWKPGQSGYPRGRKRGHKSFKTEFAEDVQRKMALVENGRRRMVRAQKVIIRQLVAKAAQGDLKALELLLRYRLLDADIKSASPSNAALPPEQEEVFPYRIAGATFNITREQMDALEKFSAMLEKDRIEFEASEDQRDCWNLGFPSGPGPV